MNILYISARNVLSDNYPYKYYGDLYRELRLSHNVYVYQDVVTNITEILHRHKHNNIDCVVFGLGYFAQKDSQVFSEIVGMRELSIPKIAYFHKPQTMLNEKLNFCKINNFDLFVDSQITYKKHGEIANCDSLRLPFVASEKEFYPRQVDKLYDVGFSGTMRLITPEGKVEGPTRDLRDRIYDKISMKNEYNLYWNAHNSSSDRISSIDAYATKINQSKIWLATTGPTKDISPRFFEVMLSKTLLFCNDMPYEYEGMFIDGENCIMYRNDLTDFDEKLDYYLNNEDERNKIISSAYNDAIKRYTWKCMADKLVSKIRGINK